MSNTAAGLRRKINSAGDLQTVVRTMKALAASSVGQYEKSVRALADYHHAMEIGLGAALREAGSTGLLAGDRGRSDAGPIGAIVFGSDQGLVGPFNEVVASHAIKALAALPGELRVWAIGERVHALLTNAGLPRATLFAVPNSLETVAPLVGQIQMESEAHRANDEHALVYVFHNRPRPGALYEPIGQRLLPLDAQWQRGLVDVRWPTRRVPEILCGGTVTLRALVREYLFISLFRACAESLMSENASRLAAMERADKNIDELLEGLRSTFHRLRQQRIDEELFDVVSGYESLGSEHGRLT